MSIVSSILKIHRFRIETRFAVQAAIQQCVVDVSTLWPPFRLHTPGSTLFLFTPSVTQLLPCPTGFSPTLLADCRSRAGILRVNQTLRRRAAFLQYRRVRFFQEGSSTRTWRVDPYPFPRSDRSMNLVIAPRAKMIDERMNEWKRYGDTRVEQRNY